MLILFTNESKNKDNGYVNGGKSSEGCNFNSW